MKLSKELLYPEIKKIIHTEGLNDFEMVDAIVEVFVKYDIDIGGCHDF